MDSDAVDERSTLHSPSWMLYISLSVYCPQTPIPPLNGKFPKLEYVFSPNTAVETADTVVSMILICWSVVVEMKLLVGSTKFILLIQNSRFTIFMEWEVLCR